MSMYQNYVILLISVAYIIKIVISVKFLVFIEKFIIKYLLKINTYIYLMVRSLSKIYPIVKANCSYTKGC